MEFVIAGLLRVVGRISSTLRGRDDPLGDESWDSALCVGAAMASVVCFRSNYNKLILGGVTL